MDENDPNVIGFTLAGILAMIIAAIGSMLLLGCAAGPWRASYAAAATIGTAASEAHQALWSEPARERLAECDVPSVKTQADFDACMEPFTVARSSRVLQAVRAFHAAQAAHSAALSATHPTEAKRSGLLPTALALCSAGRELVAAVDAEGLYLDRFDLVTAGMCKP